MRLPYTLNLEFEDWSQMNRSKVKYRQNHETGKLHKKRDIFCFKHAWVFIFAPYTCLQYILNEFEDGSRMNRSNIGKTMKQGN